MPPLRSTQRIRFARLVGLATLLVLFPLQPAWALHADGSATVELLIDDGRPMVMLRVEGPGGAMAHGRFLVDTGGGAFILPEATAREAGIVWGEPMTAEGRELARPETAVTARMSDLELPLRPERTLVAIGREIGLLPGHVLAKFHVVFDYPARTLTFAPPGSVEPIGRSMPMPVSQPMGFPRTEIELGDERLGMLLDTGPAATILSDAVVARLHDAHPQWPYHDDAREEAEALERAGGQVLATLVARNARWAGLDIGPVTLASQQEGVFENWMSGMMTAPIVGALGSNVFLDFRLELDYANETLYLSRRDCRDGSSPSNDGRCR